MWPCCAPLHIRCAAQLERHLTSVRDRLRWGLGLWLRGMLLAHNGCQDSAAALEFPGDFETVRRELREWICDDADRPLSWGPGQEMDVAACFPELFTLVGGRRLSIGLRSGIIQLL